MNKDIQTLIEREAKEYAERIKKNTRFSSNERIAATAAFKRGASIISEAIINQFKWRNFTSELLCIGQRIICIGRKGNFHLSNPISHDGIHWLSENFIEWMPIPQVD